MPTLLRDVGMPPCLFQMRTIDKTTAVEIKADYFLSGPAENTFAAISDNSSAIMSYAWSGDRIALWHNRKKVNCPSITHNNGEVFFHKDLLVACNAHKVSIWNYVSRTFVWESHEFETQVRSGWSVGDSLVFVLDAGFAVLDIGAYSVFRSSVDLSNNITLGVHHFDKSIVALIAEELSDVGTRVLLVDVFTGKCHVDLQLDLTLELVTCDAILDRILTYCANSSQGLVWDVRSGQCLARLPLPGMWQGLAVTPEFHLLAQLFDINESVEQRKLEFWKLDIPTCIARFSEVAGIDLAWVGSTGFLALFDPDGPSNADGCGVVQFLNPLTGSIVAYTHSHSKTLDSYRISKNGSQFISVFTTNTQSVQGPEIPAGTVAISDLTALAKL